MEQTNVEMLEDIRRIAFNGSTLDEVYKYRGCIFCKKDLSGELRDYEPYQIDEWLEHGFCPACSILSQQEDKLHKAPKYMHIK